MKEDLHRRVEEAMQSLDSLQRAEANAFLYSKVRNRMQKAKEFMPQQLAWRMVAALIVIAILNVLTIQHFNTNEKTKNGAASVAKEYAISLPQTY